MNLKLFNSLELAVRRLTLDTYIFRSLYVCNWSTLKAHLQISKKRCFGKYCSCDQACHCSCDQAGIFSFKGYTLTELFRKSDNWRQIYKQTSSTFYSSNDVSRRKKILIRHNKVAKQLLNTVVLFQKNTEAATGDAEAVTGGVL